VRPPLVASLKPKTQNPVLHNTKTLDPKLQTQNPNPAFMKLQTPKL